MPKAVLSHLLERLLLLPGGPILLIAAGLILWRSRGVAWVAVLGLGLLYLASLPATTRLLWARMAVPPPVDPASARNRAEAIVILGATRYSRAPEYGGRDDLTGLGLERVRYGAWLQRRTGLPVLVSGRGWRAPGERSEAAIMADILEHEFHVPVAWKEEQSHSTYENARYSSRLLRQLRIGRILLVTHAYHMPRAREAFEAMGLTVVPAPTVYFQTFSEYAVFDWLPEMRALRRNRLLVHEIVGRWWYRWRYY